MQHIAMQSQATSAGFAKVFSDIADSIDKAQKSLSDAVMHLKEDDH